MPTLLRTNLVSNPSFETASGTVTVRTNLCTNPSVEVDSTNWNFWAGGSGAVSAARSTTAAAYIGNAFYRVTWTTSQTAGNGQRGGVWMDACSVTPGKVYSVRAASRTSRYQDISIQVEWITIAKDSTVSIVTGPTIGANEFSFKLLKLENLTAPVGAAWLRVAVYSAPVTGTPWLVGEYIDVDAVVVEEAPTVSDHYFDGSTTPSNLNLALSRNATGISGNVVNIYHVTDGNILSDYYSTGPEPGAAWVQVDLGSVMTVDTIKIWHYHLDLRTYSGTKTEVSTDGVTWITVFDSTVSGTYVESSAGKTHTFAARDVRYIRDWTNGSTSNPGNHWVEIQAYNISKPDFTHSWTGPANASTTIQQAPGLANYGAESAIHLWQSALKTGRIRYKGAGGAVSASTSGDLVAGNTATILTRVRAIGATANFCAWLWDGSSSAGYNAAETVGTDWTVIRKNVTVTSAIAATDTLFLTVSQGEVEVEYILLINEVYNGPYFDGNTTDTAYKVYDWTGAVNNSTSTESSVLANPAEQYSVADLKSAYHLGNEYQFLEDSVGINNLSLADLQLAHFKSKSGLSEGALSDHKNKVFIDNGGSEKSYYMKNFT